MMGTAREVNSRSRLETFLGGVGYNAGGGGGDTERAPTLDVLWDAESNEFGTLTSKASDEEGEEEIVMGGGGDDAKEAVGDRRGLGDEIYHADGEPLLDVVGVVAAGVLIRYQAGVHGTGAN